MRILLTIMVLMYTHVLTSAQTANDVFVVQENTMVPRGFKHLGKVSAGFGSMRGKCGYDWSVNSVKEKTFKAGGNVFKIHRVYPEGSRNQCYCIEGDAYYTDDLPAFIKAYEAETAAAEGDFGEETDSGSVIYLYRPSKSSSLLDVTPPVKLYVGNADTCRLATGENCTVKIATAGPVAIRTGKDKEPQLELHVEAGKAYFIRCMDEPGPVFMRLKIERVPADVGMKGFNKNIADKTK